MALERLYIPVLCYQLRKDLVFGMLVGSNVQYADQSVASLTQTFSNYLQRRYKRYDEYPDVDLDDPKLRIVEVSTRPSYIDKTGYYPLPHQVAVPVPAVYGENEAGVLECHLPLFDIMFHYYDQRQLNTLLKTISLNVLSDTPPEQIHRMCALPKPELVLVELRINQARQRTWSLGIERPAPQLLQQLAERFPPRKPPKGHKLATQPDSAWELEDKVEEIIQTLLLTEHSVLVLGEHGVGKSAALRQAFRKMQNYSRKGDIDRSFWRLNPQQITASSKYLGEWQGKLETLVEELKQQQGILWLDNIMDLLSGDSDRVETSMAAFLLPYLSSQQVQVAAEISPRELDSLRSLMPNFARAFQLVHIPQLPEHKIYSILERYADHVKQTRKIHILPEAIKRTYTLLDRYFPYEQFPGKALRFFGSCIHRIEQDRQEQHHTSDSVLGSDLVIQTMEEQTGMPALFLKNEHPLDPIELKSFFEQRIIGQEAAVEELCRIVKIFKTGLNNPRKPIATMLFAGPTGVGKTASAKALADYFFGKGQKGSPLIRIDMSEYQSPMQLSRLLGEGNKTSELVRSVRERPFSVVLFDEVEKAHPAVFDTLLTLFDEGLLIDGFGRMTCFYNTIIILTSNLGAEATPALGFNTAIDPEQQYLSAIRRFFRPEFVNRIDTILPFNKLGRTDVLQIAHKELREVVQLTGLRDRNISLVYSDNIVEHLLNIGFDERYGARPLQRAIDRTIVQPLALWLLKNPDIVHQTIHVSLLEGRIVFSKPT